jgi:hypothetical protein
MNLQQSFTMGILTLAIGISGMKPGDAYDSPVKPSVTTPAKLNSQHSSFTIAQVTEANSPLYGTWNLQYSIDGIIYKSFLRMRGYWGSMRTWYFNPLISRTVAVDQTMQLKSSSSGLILLGYNPVYADTTIRAAYYNPDNFLFQVSTDGSLVVVTCDNARQCSSVDLEVVR